MSGHRPHVQMDVDPNISATARERTRTPKSHKHPVRVLSVPSGATRRYSHSTQAAYLQLCHIVALSSPACAPRPSAKRPGLRDRFTERDIAELITAYRSLPTAKRHRRLPHHFPRQPHERQAPPAIAVARRASPLGKLQRQHQPRRIRNRACLPFTAHSMTARLAARANIHRWANGPARNAARRAHATGWYHHVV
jgi:hypothetical protein